MTAMYQWDVLRGESAGLTCPVIDDDGAPVDASAWPTTAVIRSEPGGAVLHTFSGIGLLSSGAGVHLSLSSAESAAAQWRRGWLEVIVTDPNAPTEVSMIVHGPVNVTDS